MTRSYGPPSQPPGPPPRRGVTTYLLGAVGVLAIAVAVALVVWVAVGPERSEPRAVRDQSSGAMTSTTVAVPLPAADDLLLAAGAATPVGPAEPTAMGSNFFRSAEPARCAPALLSKDSPLLSPGPEDHAEAAYPFGDVFLAESIDTYRQPLDPDRVIRDGSEKVAACTGVATAISGHSRLEGMRLGQLSTPAPGVLVWQMSTSSWYCDYGLAVAEHVTLVTSYCAAQPSFPMADWTATRRAQLLAQEA